MTALEGLGGEGPTENPWQHSFYCLEIERNLYQIAKKALPIIANFVQLARMTKSTSSTFDFSIYLRAPMITIASGISLAEALVDACPKKAPSFVKKAHKKLIQVAKEARTAWAERQRETNQFSEQDRRLLDQEADNSWSGLRHRLLGYTLLPPDSFSKSQRASELLLKLFGSSGLSFLNEPYPVQSATMLTMLERIELDRLDKEIDALCGPEFMQHLRSVIPRYQKMAQSFLQPTQGSTVDLREHMRALSSAMFNYTTKIIAMLEDDDDQEMIVVIQTALAPMDAYREQNANRRGKSNAPTSPTPAPAS